MQEMIDRVIPTVKQEVRNPHGVCHAENSAVILHKLIWYTHNVSWRRNI